MAVTIGTQTAIATGTGSFTVTTPDYVAGDVLFIMAAAAGAVTYTESGSSDLTLLDSHVTAFSDDRAWAVFYAAAPLGTELAASYTIAGDPSFYGAFGFAVVVSGLDSEDPIQVAGANTQYFDDDTPPLHSAVATTADAWALHYSGGFNHFITLTLPAGLTLVGKQDDGVAPGFHLAGEELTHPTSSLTADAYSGYTLTPDGASGTALFNVGSPPVVAEEGGVKFFSALGVGWRRLDPDEFKKKKLEVPAPLF